MRRDLTTGATEIATLSASGAVVSLGPYTSNDSISADGNVVSFSSDAATLVVPDANGDLSDVFVRDFSLGALELASVDSSGVQGNSISWGSSLSASGRFIAFISLSSNLVANDTNGAMDAFWRDRVTGVTRRVSVDSTGAQSLYVGQCTGPHCEPIETVALSGDGRFVAFASKAINLSPFDANGTLTDVFVHDTLTDATELVSTDLSGISSMASWAVRPSISHDGRYVTFDSYGTGLTSTPTFLQSQVYRRDLLTQVTEMVSVDPTGVGSATGAGEAVLSPSGRFVAFASSSDLAPPVGAPGRDILVRDMLAGSTEKVSPAAVNPTALTYYWIGSIRGDGRAVVFQAFTDEWVAGDTNASWDVFLADFNYQAPPITTYCSATTNSRNCEPSITSAGLPTLSGQYAFFVSATGALNQRPGALMWGHAPAQTPFLGGLRCAATPFHLAPPASTDGYSTPVNDCSGWRSQRFTPADMLANGWSAGTPVYTQFVFRDPTLATGPVSLSNALQFQVLP